MRILRTTLLGVAAFGTAGWLLTSLNLVAQTQGRRGDAPHMPMASGKSMMSDRPTLSKEQKIANAISAGMPSITDKATILDWPAKEGEAPAMLRSGSNGWTCMPDMPDTQGNDPACMDKPWVDWADAYMAHKAPATASVGVGYMMAPGGGWGSNTDPYAMKATSDNQWHLAPPHLMILVPDPKSLAGMSSDPANGGPYVMYPGTPYAHLMVPIKSPAASTSMKMTGR